MNNAVRKKLRSTFYVTPLKGHEFEGVLLSTDREYHVFGNVKVYATDMPQSVDGDVYIERSNVAYMQLLVKREAQ